MPRWSLLLALGLIFLSAGCAPLNEDAAPENLVPLATLPADYGELVTVLHYRHGDDPPSWDEMWFENEDTGTVTRVPVHRATWSYDPARVRQITRMPARTAGGEATP